VEQKDESEVERMNFFYSPCTVAKGLEPRLYACADSKASIWYALRGKTELSTNLSIASCGGGDFCNITHKTDSANYAADLLMPSFSLISCSKSLKVPKQSCTKIGEPSLKSD